MPSDSECFAFAKAGLAMLCLVLFQSVRPMCCHQLKKQSLVSKWASGQLRRTNCYLSFQIISFNLSVLRGVCFPCPKPRHSSCLQCLNTGSFMSWSSSLDQIPGEKNSLKRKKFKFKYLYNTNLYDRSPGWAQCIESGEANSQNLSFSFFFSLKFPEASSMSIPRQDSSRITFRCLSDPPLHLHQCAKWCSLDAMLTW